MAEKKYLDLTGLSAYDAKIKALMDSKDAAKLTDAKAYADSLASNYDAAGSAASALTDAKAHTDTEVAKANAAAAAAQTQADKGVADAATAQVAADKAQSEVDALETLVGTLPEGSTVTNVVAYVDKKTEGVASEGAMTQLSGRVSTVEGKVATIEGDYLKAADKTGLQGLITAEEEAREAADAAIDERLVEVEAFFKLAEDEQLDTALDTLVEIQTYLDTEGAAADKMVLDIAANASAIEAIEKDYLKAADKTELTNADAAIIERLEAVETELGDGEGSVADQIADAVAAEAALRVSGDKAAEASAAAALAAAQAADKKAVDAQGEVDALEKVVATKAAASDVTALTGRVATAEGKITTLEGASHSHDNKAALDAITAQLTAQWSEAYTKAHTHENIDVLNGITSTLVSSWSAAEGNAKSYTDEKIGEFVAITNSEVDALFTA